MSYHHQFTGQVEGIRPTAPARWRQLDGLMGVFWEAEGDVGGRGYYLSQNPRISVFFSDVSSIRVAHEDGARGRMGRPLARAYYVPAGMPMWTRFTTPLNFSHLDIHLTPERMMQFLGSAVSRSVAQELLVRPAEARETRDLEVLARLLVKDVSAPSRNDLYAESLIGALLSGVLNLQAPGNDRPEGRLTAGQMRKIVARFEANGGRRMTLAEMAETVQLSESWFSHVFKQTVGVTPLKWQSMRRVDLARRMLAEDELSVAEIADRLGFSDQAHLTKVFRRIVGQTPAAWRRDQRAGQGRP